MKTQREIGLGEGAPNAVRRRQFDDRGAAMVEFALILPVLLVLLFGIFEFGFVFGQHLDVRHSAREGARLGVVNFKLSPSQSGNAQATALVNAVCDRMEMASGATVSWLSPQGNAPVFGDFLRITVTADPEQVTGFFSPILNNVTLSSTVEMRLEQTPTFTIPHTGTCA